MCNAVAIFYPALFWFIPLYPVYLAGWGGFFLKGFSDGLPRGFNELDLSEEQKSKIRSIMAQYRPQQPENHAARRAEFQQKMAQRQAQEQQLIGGKNFDEQAARKLIAERQQERAELERQHAEHELQMLKARHATFQVLTPAQQQKFIALQKQQHQRFAERMAQRRP